MDGVDRFAGGIWCAPVSDWPTLLAEDAFTRLDMLQRLTRGTTPITTAPGR